MKTSQFRSFMAAAVVMMVTFFSIGMFTSLHHVKIPSDLIIKPVRGQVVKPNKTQANLQNAYNSTVAILSPDGSIRGSGIVLQHTKGKPIVILTAFHVIAELFPSDVLLGKLDTGEVHKAMIFKVDQAHDLAILVTPYAAKEDGFFVKLAANEPVLGDTLWVIGNPRGMIGNVTRGILSNILTVEDGSTYYRIDAALFYGNSGGGTFNDKGELIGIAHAVETMGGELIPGGGLLISLPAIKIIVSAGV